MMALDWTKPLWTRDGRSASAHTAHCPVKGRRSAIVPTGNSSTTYHYEADGRTRFDGKDSPADLFNERPL